MSTRVPANLIRGLQAIGGHLEVLDDRLEFRTYATNPHPEHLVIPFVDISDARESASFSFMNNGLTLRLHSGAEIRFVVQDPGPLIGLIPSRLNR